MLPFAAFSTEVCIAQPSSCSVKRSQRLYLLGLGSLPLPKVPIAEIKLDTLTLLLHNQCRGRTSGQLAILDAVGQTDKAQF